MARGVLVRVPVVMMAAIVGGVVVLVEALGIVAGLGLWSLGLLVIPGALAVAYVLEYRTLPEPEPEPPVPAPGPAGPLSPGDEEEFVDPVEEADRLSQRPATPDAEGAVPSAPESEPDPGDS